MMRRVLAGLAMSIVIAGATRANAQEPLRPVVASGGINVIVGLPTGEFKNYLEGDSASDGRAAGFGLNLNGVLPVKHNSPLALRADLGFLVYGSETKRVCFSQTVGCRILLDVTTTNSIFFANVGPQLMIPSGPIRPYVNGAVGFSYFNTSSSIDGSSGNEDFASTNNFDDATLAWAGGGGILIQLSSGKTPVALDIGARYNSNGSVEYLKKGDIHDNPDGSITFSPTRSEANLMTLNIGVSIGIRPDSKK